MLFDHFSFPDIELVDYLPLEGIEDSDGFTNCPISPSPSHALRHIHLHVRFTNLTYPIWPLQEPGYALPFPSKAMSLAVYSTVLQYRSDNNSVHLVRQTVPSTIGCGLHYSSLTPDCAHDINAFPCICQSSFFFLSSTINFSIHPQSRKSSLLWISTM